MLPGLIPFLGLNTGAAAATISYNAEVISGSGTSSFTFTGVSIGTAASNRFVIVTVCCGGIGTGTATLNSVTIGGVSATALKDPGTFSPGTTTAAIWGATVPTGTTATIVVTYSAVVAGCSVGSYSATASSTTPTSTQIVTGATAGLSASMSGAAGCIMIGCCASFSGTASTFTWSGLTKNFDDETQVANLASVTGASSAFATAQSGLTVSATCSNLPSVTAMLTVVVLK